MLRVDGGHPGSMPQQVSTNLGRGLPATGVILFRKRLESIVYRALTRPWFGAWCGVYQIPQSLQYDVCGCQYGHCSSHGRTNTQVLLEKGGNNTAVMKCDHYDAHEFHNEKKFMRRTDPSQSLLWTFVRHPMSRDLSELYHFHVTRLGLDPDSEEALRKLRNWKSKQSKYLASELSDRQELTRLMKDMMRMTMTMMDPTSSFGSQASAMLRNRVLRPYYFIGITERMSESLAVMTLLWGLEPSDVIVLSAKKGSTGNHYDGGIFQDTCFRMVPPPSTKEQMGPRMAAYYFGEGTSSSSTGRHSSTAGHLDYLLYYAANESLDRTIESLGVERVQQRARLIEQLQALANDQCLEEAIFPCSKDGVRQVNESKVDCYFGDSGCGYRCVDRVLQDRKEENEQASRLLA